MNINWDAVLIALIQAFAAVVTAWIQRRCKRKGGQHRKRAGRSASHT